MSNKQYLDKKEIIASIFPSNNTISLRVVDSTHPKQKYKKILAKLKELSFNADYSKCIFNFNNSKTGEGLNLDFKFYNKMWWIYR